MSSGRSYGELEFWLHPTINVFTDHRTKLQIDRTMRCCWIICIWRRVDRIKLKGLQLCHISV
jgi:hypothetical protein